MTSPGLMAFSLIGTSTAVGAALVAVGMRPLLAERRARLWPRAPGTIQASAYETRDTSGRDANGDEVSSTMFTPVVAYEYTVDGKTYSGSRVRLSSVATSRADVVKRFIDRYPPRARVEVLYDPSDPSHAVLETGVSTGGVFLVAFGSLFLLLALLGLLLLFLASR